jgi:hypothetical protein
VRCPRATAWTTSGAGTGPVMTLGSDRGRSGRPERW